MYLYGSSGHGKVVIEILENSGISIEGLFDDNPDISSLFGYKCLIFDQYLILNSELIVSIGDNVTGKLVVDKIGSVNFGVAIDVSSSISRRSVIGKGSVIMPGVSVNSGTILGNHVIINTNAAVDHDCFLEDFVHISPGCSISGNVNIGEGSHVGTGASVIQNIRIGKWCIIGAGCVIIRDVPDFSVVVGNPGRIIKKNNCYPNSNIDS
ncbi:MAG: acetyltransferase [Bacteroidales bacterium]|nr:acetyltransferase [Bacteroidales bacterium]